MSTETLEVIKIVELAGDRREFFVPELGLFRLTSGLIKGKTQSLVREIKSAVNRLKQLADTALRGQNEFQMELFKQLESWRRQLGRVLPVFQTILKIPYP